MPDLTVTLPATVWKAVADILGHDLDSDHYDEFPEFLAQIETAHAAIDTVLGNAPAEGNQA